MDVLEHIREQVRANRYEFSLHAEHEREDEHILVEELEQSVMSGELLEGYPDDPRGTVVSLWALPGVAERSTVSGVCCRTAGCV